MSEQQRVELGKYVVVDPEICHGKPTFKGTRVFVADVLDQVAEGMSWDEILSDWNGISREAIAEAIGLARDALLDRVRVPAAA